MMQQRAINLSERWFNQSFQKKSAEYKSLAVGLQNKDKKDFGLGLPFCRCLDVQTHSCFGKQTAGELVLYGWRFRRKGYTNLGVLQEKFLFIYKFAFHMSLLVLLKFEPPEMLGNKCSSEITYSLISLLRSCLKS